MAGRPGGGGEYYAGFLIEKSLSIDNVFVWAVIFSFFAVPREYQFRVLFWGIFGALVLRAVFIFAGVALIERFEWVLYVFGAFLLYTAWKIARHDETKQVDYNQQHRHAAGAATRARRPTSTTARSCSPSENAKRVATPLFAVLVLIEATDVVFAVDSVPAILAVSREPFIVFASNAFAILGLRSLYFLLGGMQGKFRYLNVGLGVILAFVGMKMLLIGEPFEVHLPDVRLARRHRRRADRRHRRLAAGRLEDVLLLRRSAPSIRLIRVARLGAGRWSGRRSGDRVRPRVRRGDRR